MKRPVPGRDGGTEASEPHQHHITAGDTSASHRRQEEIQTPQYTS